MENDSSHCISGGAQNVLDTLSKGERPADMDAAMDALFELAGQIEKDREEKERLRELATIHPLTGFQNKSSFMIEMKKEQERVDFDRSRGGVLVSIDIAKFKDINDNYSESVGDLAISKIAEVINAVGFRDTDILASPGGDEFYVIMSDTDFDFPETKIADWKVQHDFNKDNTSAWKKIEELSRALRMVPFIFEFEGQEQTELLSSRVSVVAYNSEVSIYEARDQANIRANKYLKKMMPEFLMGKR